VSWRYLIGVVEIYDRFHGDIWSVSWRYFKNALEIFNLCLGDI